MVIGFLNIIRGGYNVYHFVEKWLRLVNEFIGKGVIGGA